MFRITTLIILITLGGVNCQRSRPTDTPVGTVRLWIERMRQYRGNPDEAKFLLTLFSNRTRTNLQQRAERYSATTGKAISAEAMIVPSHFTMRFEPVSFTAQISGTTATVNLSGMLANEKATVQCVFEDGFWRVDLTLPPLAPPVMVPR